MECGGSLGPGLFRFLICPLRSYLAFALYLRVCLYVLVSEGTCSVPRLLQLFGSADSRAAFEHPLPPAIAVSIRSHSDSPAATLGFLSSLLFKLSSTGPSRPHRSRPPYAYKSPFEIERPSAQQHSAACWPSRRLSSIFDLSSTRTGCSE